MIMLLIFLFLPLSLGYPSNLPIVAYQQFTGKKLPPCSISINETVDERFRRLDRHRKFQVSFDDFLYADQCAVQFRRNAFNNGDLNSDGNLDRTEWDVWSRNVDREKRKEKLAENRKLFEYFDKDVNSRIDARELRKYIRYRRCNPTNVKYFLRAKNALDFSDFDAFTYMLPNQMFPLGRRNRTTPKKPDYGDGECQKPETHTEEFLRIDTNQDQKLSFDEFLQLERCAIMRHKRKFKSMDTNGDRYLSIYEFRKFYTHRDEFWKKVYDMRMNNVVHLYDQNGDMHMDKKELREFLRDRKIYERNLDVFLGGRLLSPKEFADWEETLPNTLFPSELL